MSDYFSNFNDWKNTTGAESVHSSGQDGDYASHIIGSNWTFQDGDVTWYQTGNMGTSKLGCLIHSLKASVSLRFLG